MLEVGKMKTSDNYSTVIYTICMYCKKFIGTKDGGGIYGTSHGICDTCSGKRIAELKEITK